MRRTTACNKAGMLKRFLAVVVFSDASGGLRQATPQRRDDLGPWRNGALMPHSWPRISFPHKEPTVTLTRRQFAKAAAFCALAGSSLGAALFRFATTARADTPEPDAAELAQPGPDGDVVLGSEKAPVTMIEYASMTCPHCAHSRNDLPELQEALHRHRQGARLFREFPLDALAAAGFMLARCAGKDKFMPVVETLFAKQPEWMVQKPIEPLRHHRQAVRLHRGILRPMPGESKRARQHPDRARPRRHEARRQFHPDFLHQWQEADRGPVNPVCWLRVSTLISRTDKGFFAPALGRATARKPLRSRASRRRNSDNPASLLR